MTDDQEALQISITDRPGSADTYVSSANTKDVGDVADVR